MKNIALSWDLPTTRVDGGPLNPTDIAKVEVFVSADQGVNFVLLNTLLPTDTQGAFIPDQDWGTWVFRFIVTDTGAKASLPLDFFVDVPDDSAPGQVVNVQVILS